MAIRQFEYEYAFLSNRYPTTIEIDEHTYGSAEAAYWALLYSEDADKISTMTALEAIHYGNDRCMQAIMDEGAAVPTLDQRLEAMERVLRVKFSKQSLRRMLIGTDPQTLINMTADDTFWGKITIPTERGCMYRGDNHLGKLLMKIRRGCI